MKIMLKNSPEILELTHVTVDSNNKIQGYYSKNKQIPKEDILKVFEDVESEFSEIWL